MQEFFEQGDREKELGNKPMGMYDRDVAIPSQSQVGFIEFVVGPLFVQLIRMFPQLSGLGDHLVENRGRYARMHVDSITDEEKRAAANEKNESSQAAFAAKFTQIAEESRNEQAEEEAEGQQAAPTPSAGRGLLNRLLSTPIAGRNSVSQQNRVQPAPQPQPTSI